MQNYDYDDSGLITSYLLLAFFLPLFFYQLYIMLAKHRKFPCSCPNCKKHVDKGRLAMTAIITIVLAILLKNIFTTAYKPKNSAFNPFETLNITEEASLQEIKRAYRKAIFKLGKIKVSPGATKEQETAAKKEQETTINRAFEILKSKKSYDEWFSKAKETTLVIAIPAIFMRFYNFSVFGYLVILAIIPLFAFYLYRRIRSDTQYGGSFEANEQLIDNIESLAGDLLIQKTLVFISRMPDFTHHKFRNDLLPHKTEIEDIGGVPMAIKSQSYLHIMDYLCRSQFASPKDCAYVKRKLLGILAGYIGIAKEIEKTQLFEMLLVLQKMVVQAIPLPEYMGMQNPAVTVQDAIMKREVKKDFGALIPKVEFTNISLEVMGEQNEVLQPKSGGEYQIEQGTTVTINFCLKKLGGYESLCHSPYGMPVSVEHKWYVYMKIDGKLEGEVLVINRVGKERKLRFSFLARKNKSLIRLYAISNGYFGVDVNTPLAVKSC